MIANMQPRRWLSEVWRQCDDEGCPDRVGGGGLNFFSAESLAAAAEGTLQGGAAPAGELTGVSIDTRGDLRGQAFVALKGASFDGHDFLDAACKNGAAVLVIEAAHAARVPRGAAAIIVRDTRLALQRMALVWRGQFHGKVVAITGSVGKTTTRRLLAGAIADSSTVCASPKSFNNDIGVPLTIMSARHTHQYLLIEIGTNHPGEVAALGAMAQAQIAILTMAGRSHLLGLGSIEAVAREKASLVATMSPAAVVLVNGDCEPLMRAVVSELALRSDIRLVTFGLGANCDWRLLGREAHGHAVQLVRVGTGAGTVQFRLALPGEHNALNATAALAAADELGVSQAHAVAGLAQVQPADMRFTPTQVNGITVYNDAYNANPESMLAAIRTFAEVTRGGSRRIVCLGDMLELGDSARQLHGEVGRVLATAFDGSPPDLVFLVGSLSAGTAQALREAAPHAAVVHHAMMSSRASDDLLALLQPGDGLLLKGSRGSEMERILQSLHNCGNSSKRSDTCSTT